MSSTMALDILKVEIPIDQFNSVTAATEIYPIPMSAYANDLAMHSIRHLYQYRHYAEHCMMLDFVKTLISLPTMILVLWK
jgi:hypothetical protein